MTTTTIKGESSAMARHIAQVAARLFAARGYDATPVRAIVEAAGVTKPTLYYHFGSKEGLAQALLTMPMTRLVETSRRILDGPGTAEEKLVAMLDAHLAWCRENPDRVRFIHAVFFGPLGSSLAGELERIAAAMNELTVDTGRRMAEAALIEPARAADFALAMRGLIMSHTMNYLYCGGELPPDLARRLAGDLLRGFGVPQRGQP